MASGNPLYPGYYPGTPYIREPSGGGSKSKRPPEYQPSTADTFFEALSSTPPTSIPFWLWQQEVQQAEDSFLHFAGALSAPELEKGYGRYAGIETEIEAGQQQFGAEEAQELPGAAGIMVNLNPVDWIKDPVKQVKKHFESSYRAIADLQDFTTDTKVLMWAGEKDKKGNVTRPGYFTDERSPFYLRNADGLEALYKDVEVRVPLYMRNSASAIFRNKAFAEANVSILNALSIELYAKRTSFTGEARREVDLFEAGAAVADSMADLGGALYKTNESFGGVFINKRIFDKDGRDKTADEVNKLGGEIARAKAAIGKFEGLGVEVPKELGKYKDFIQTLDEEFSRHVRVERVGGVSKWVLNEGSETALNKVVDFRRTQLFRATANAGIGGTYINNLTNREVRDRKSNLNKAINAKRADGSYIVSEAGRKVGLVSAMVRRDYEWMTAMDLASAFEEGKLLRQYLWANIIYPRIKRSTPSYYIDRLKDKVVAHKFTKDTYKLIKGNRVFVEGVSFKGVFKGYARKLEWLQKSTLNKAYGWAFRPAEMIGRRIWDAVLIALEGAFGGATGGVGAVVFWVVRQAFAYIVTKATKYLSNTFKALKKMDAGYFFEGTLVSLARIVMVAGIVFAIPAFIIIMLFGMVLTVISPVDSTKTGSYSVGQGTLSPQNTTTSDQTSQPISPP